MRIFVLAIVIILIAVVLLARRATPAQTLPPSSGNSQSGAASSLQLARTRGEIVDADGKAIAAEALPSRTYTFIYFSANWCPPCHRFTPSLVKFYQDAGPSRPFNIIMVDEDQAQSELTQYASSTGMPWSFAKLDGDLAARLQHDYGNAGIPDLVLVDGSGAVLADSFHGQEYRGPQAVLEDYGKLPH